MSNAVQGGMLHAGVSDGRKHGAQAQSKHVIKIYADLSHPIYEYIMHNKLTDDIEG